MTDNTITQEQILSIINTLEINILLEKQALERAQKNNKVDQYMSWYDSAIPSEWVEYLKNRHNNQEVINTDIIIVDR